MAGRLLPMGSTASHSKSMRITTESPQLQYLGIEVDDALEISEQIGTDGVDVELPNHDRLGGRTGLAANWHPTRLTPPVKVRH